MQPITTPLAAPAVLLVVDDDKSSVAFEIIPIPPQSPGNPAGRVLLNNFLTIPLRVSRTYGFGLQRAPPLRVDMFGLASHQAVGRNPLPPMWRARLR